MFYKGGFFLLFNVQIAFHDILVRAKVRHQLSAPIYQYSILYLQNKVLRSSSELSLLAAFLSKRMASLFSLMIEV